MNGFREEKMAQSKVPLDSISTSHTQKPFVRLDDIGDAGIIVGIISGVFFSCICADDGTPLDNGVVTYGGNDYKNVTVVKCAGGRQEGKTTTTSSGAYTFQNTLPRGYNFELTVTSTHYHQHGTGASSSLKKCIYSHTEYLNDVGDVIETVEKDFVLKPTMESYPLQSHSSD